MKLNFFDMAENCHKTECNIVCHIACTKTQGWEAGV